MYDNAVDPCPDPRWPRLTAVVVAASALVVAIAILLSPSSLLGKADLVGYAVCHRLADRSFFVAGRQFPLCARCTGTFLGALLGLIWVAAWGRLRASRLPPLPILAVLIGFVSLWAFDGLNSYLTLFPGAPYLYEPRNWLRMTTGLLNGLALILFVMPIHSFTLWRTTQPRPVLSSLRELCALLLVAGALLLAVQSGIDWLLYPLALLSSAGVLLLLILINSMLVAVALGREGYASTWAQALVPLTIAFALAISQIAALAALRFYLTSELGLTF